MDGGAWWATVCGVAKSRTQLSNQHTHTHTHWAPDIAFYSFKVIQNLSFLGNSILPERHKEE